jgi:hypothetical protein
MKSIRIKPDEQWFLIVWLLLSVWLLASALLIRGEYADGYNTIANARYFFGDNPDYYFQRGPLAAFVLWPVEAIVRALALNSFDVRPYHLFSGLLHSAYLLGCWLLLKRTGQLFVPRIIAFATAILSVIFFAYAPYLSHDIIPGLLFLILIFACNRWFNDPTIGTALLLILLGTAVTFIKQTYAIFWISLCVYAALAFICKWNNGRVTARKMFLLFGLAGLSCALSWIGYGWVTAGEISKVSLLERPIILIQSVSAQYQDEADLQSLFPWTIYLRNLHNYGIATILLLLPGLVVAFRGNDARLRMIAVCWLISVLMLQSVSFKEVRYLAFLAPLSVMLIVPVIPLIKRSRILFSILLAVIVIDQYRGLSMAAVQLTSTPSLDVARFVGKVENGGRIVSSPNLSFPFMPDSPIERDRYHGIFHLSAEHLYRFNEGVSVVGKIEDPRDFGTAGIETGDRILFSNFTLVRKPPWQEDNVPIGLDALIMASGNAAEIELDLQNKLYEVQGHDGRSVMFIPPAEAGQLMPTISSAGLSISQAETMYGTNVGDNLTVIGVVIDTLCRADRCTYF